MSLPIAASYRALLSTAFALMAVLSSAPAEATRSDNLLRGLAPTHVVDVTRTARLADGVASQEGDAWRTSHAAHLRSRDARVQWDLPGETAIRCVFVQGTHNASYHLTASLDGRDFFPLWTAGPVEPAGMRLRHERVQGSARYLRLTASGGDGRFSVAEVGVYEHCPAEWPPRLDRVAADPWERVVTRRIYVFWAVMAAFILLLRLQIPWIIRVAALAPIAAGAWMISGLAELDLRDFESLFRAGIAALALLLLLSESFATRTAAPASRWATAILGMLAVAALGCYYHFGVPQFRDQAKDRWTFVHATDMRHYFPVAKYFQELRYDGLYAASLSAYIDLTPGTTILDVKDARFRDLRTYETRRAIEMAAHVDEVKARFTPERWRQFTADMKYFLDAMGPQRYLRGMHDHGANATPVWMLAPYLIFTNARASELLLSVTGAIDLVLVLVMFVVVWRTFGLRVACYVAILFGATDFYQFGSNLVGSTLRQDWLAALALGACALRRERYFLGGALVAYAGLVRAFPALSTMFLAVPLMWWLVDWVRHERTVPSLAVLQRHNGPALRALAGAATTVGVLVLVSSLVFGGQEGWGNWFKKIAMHASKPSTNNVGLRNLAMFEPAHAAKYLVRDGQSPWTDWDHHQRLTFTRREGLFYLGSAAFLALAVLACRGRPPHQAALFALVCVPFLFYPSNYYCHFIFLLPLAVAPPDGDTRNRTFAVSVAALLALCVVQFFTLREPWVDLRYTYQSLALVPALIAFTALPAWVAVRTLRKPFRGGDHAGRQPETQPETGARPVVDPV